MKYAIIRAGMVLNVIEWNGDMSFSPGESCTLVWSDDASPGDTYDGAKFTRPVLPEVVREPAVSTDPADWQNRAKGVMA